MTKKHHPFPPPPPSPSPHNLRERQEEHLLPHAVVASNPPVYPVLSPEEARALVERSSTLSLLMLTLSHGATFASRSFAAHTGLMNLLKRAYEEQDTDRFLSTIRAYLEQAQGRVAQVPQRDQIEAILSEIERLVHRYSLSVVARRLLSAQQLLR